MTRPFSTDNHFVFWAKLPRGRVTPETRETFHPLLCHMTDVAEVARLMWRETLSPVARRLVCAALGFTEEDAAEQWVVFFAGLHDLGKAGPVFTLQEDARRLSVLYEGLPRPPLASPDAYHGNITAAELPEILTGGAFGLPLKTARRVAYAIGGHHGTIPTTETVERAASAAGGLLWQRVRERLVHALADALEVPRGVTPRALGNAAAMWLAGLVSVADWIGSDERFFEYRIRSFADLTRLDLDEYRTHAATQARLALTQLGWLGWRPHTETVAFSELFPETPDPRPLQRAVIDLADELRGAGPGLVIVEAPMGEGKTEAALYLSDVWGVTPGARGCYVALPTQATSNQMYRRVRKFLRGRYPGVNVNLQLLHGHAALSAEFALHGQRGGLNRTTDKALPHLTHTGDAKESQTAQTMGVAQAEPSTAEPVHPEAIYADDRASASADCDVLAAEWFTYRKRGLLAPFGVGTVDQSLLAALQTRHGFVRLFGLAHKTVVVDEVHAYDAYMSQLLDRLLEWLAALGSSVVLLSATLPRRRRLQLLAAYARGRGLPPLCEGDGNEAGYPRLSWLNDASSGARGFPASTQFTRSVAVEWVDSTLPREPGAAFALGERLREALAHGGCAAIICNTVRRAQELYLCLKSYFAARKEADGEPCKVDLFHARYLFRDRDERERRQLARFGKPEPDNGADSASGPALTSLGAGVGEDKMASPHAARPHRAILVATQVIEQSLDLDFDLMVTELAPADLVLQRAGRLHRHERPRRPSGVERPAIWIMKQELSGNVPRFAANTDYRERKRRFIYEPHILLRSWLVLRGHEAVIIPQDVENIIERVYGDAAPHDGASGELREAWDRTRAEMEAAIKKMKLEAKKALILEPTDEGLLDDWSLSLEEDNPDVHQCLQALTRLAEPSVPVVCLRAGEAADFDEKQTPDLTRARELLKSSVTLADQRVVFALLAQEPPTGWRRSPLLRSHRLIKLDAGDSWACGKHRLRLDPELGVTITTEDS